MSTTTVRFDSLPCRRADARPLPARLLADGLCVLALWAARHRQRRELSQLTPGQLWDIGVSAADAAAEARKPFWQA